MNMIDMTGMQPEMQIAAPPANPFEPVAEETDYSRDTQSWD